MDMTKRKQRRSLFYDNEEEDVLLMLTQADIFSGSREKRIGVFLPWECQGIFRKSGVVIIARCGGLFFLQ